MTLTTLFLLLINCCTSRPAEPSALDPSPIRLKQHAIQLKSFAVGQQANTRFGILIDMSLPSWKKRLFVVDLQTDSVLIDGLVCHGQGKDYYTEDVAFSNEVGSNCSSQGRYKIGVRYYGDFGLAYKLHGLDSSNSNAFKRFVVFHAHPCVSEFEGTTICRSDGCPTVNPVVLEKTAKLIDASAKPVLMWIYR